MIQIGRINRLRIVKDVDFGLYLDGGDEKRGGKGEILLPLRYVPQQYELGDELEVFIYLDSEDRIIATTERPYVMVGEFALLKVTEINAHGIFLNWGLSKDLLLPFNEQITRMDEGCSYVVYVFCDQQSQRIAATARINDFLEEEDHTQTFKEGQEVSLFNAAKTELGYKMIINNSHWGLLHQHELSRELRRGERMQGFVRRIREDRLIDLCLHRQASDKSDVIGEQLLAALKKHDGFLPLNDKSSPEAIRETFNTSKALFKKATGALYRKRIISIEADGIRLLAKDADS